MRAGEAKAQDKIATSPAVVAAAPGKNSPSASVDVVMASEGLEDDVCQLCAGSHSTPQNPIVLCGSDATGCGKGWHLSCIGLNELPEEDWFCATCRHIAGPSSGAESDMKAHGNVTLTGKLLAAADSRTTDASSIAAAGGTGSAWGGTASRFKCKFCLRGFVSQHALDVHLTRNQVCRQQNETMRLMRRKHRTEKPATQGSRHGPQPLDLANQIISRLMQMPGAEPFNLPVDPADPEAKQYFQIVDPASAMDFSTIKGKLASGSYKSVHELRDDVLLIFFNCFRYYGPQSELYAQARKLSQKFDEQMKIKMDNVRGMGGRADALVFQHGAQWVGQEVKIYWPTEHERISGKIEAHARTEDSTHRYQVTYTDGHQEWKSLPDPHIELVGWVKPEEELLADAATGVTAKRDKFNDAMDEAEAKRAVALKGWETRRKRQLVGNGSVPSKIASRRVQEKPPSRFQAPCLGSNVLVGRGKDCVRADAFGKHDFLELVQELHKNAEYDLFDQPPDPALVPGYYHTDPLGRQRGMTAWNTSGMSFEQMAAKAARGEYPNLSAVERDLNLLVSNAVIYYAHWHMFNRQACKLFHSSLEVFDKWSRHKGSYSCKTCKQHDILNNAMLICDQCCRGIHQNCFLKAGAKALLLFSQEVVHPLRGDSAFLCSQECMKEFTSLAAHYKLTPLDPTSAERKSAFCASTALSLSLESTLSSSAKSGTEVASGGSKASAVGAPGRGDAQARARLIASVSDAGGSKMQATLTSDHGDSVQSSAITNGIDADDSPQSRCRAAVRSLDLALRKPDQLSTVVLQDPDQVVVLLRQVLVFPSHCQ